MIKLETSTSAAISVPDHNPDSVTSQQDRNFGQTTVNSLRSRVNNSMDSLHTDPLLGAEATEAAGMTLNNPPRSKWRLTSLFFYVSTCGFIDAAPGALIPRIEEYYDINYSTVSMIWVGNAVGFISVAFFSFKLESWMSKRQLISFGALFQLSMSVLVIPGKSFPLMVLGFFLSGIGGALALSQQNIFLCKFERAGVYLGIYHGSYGLGATVSPLIATAMVNAGVKWSYLYFILLGTASVNFVNMWSAFKGCDGDTKRWYTYDDKPISNDPPVRIGDEEIELENFNPGNKDLRNAIETTICDTEDIPVAAVGKTNLQFAVRDIKTWLVALFALCYAGGEVGFPGWIVSFLEDYRHGSTKTTGYIVSGFWAGLTIGRLAGTPLLDHYLGVKRSIFIFAVCSIVCVIFTWSLNNIIAEAVFISISGVFVGPMYPLMFKTGTHILPKKYQYISMTIVGAFGSTGGALFPFLIGVVSQSLGTVVVLPFFIILFCGCIVLWFAMPNPDRKTIDHFWQRVW